MAVYGGFRSFCSLPYVVSLDSSLMRKNKGNFFTLTYHLVEHPGGRSLRFPVCVGIDIHGGSYIGVTQKFLHILGRCTVGQHIGGEGMSEQMEMKLSKVRHSLTRPAAHAAYRCRGIQRLRPVLHRPWTVPYTPPALPRFSAGCTPRSRIAVTLFILAPRL